jgi:hypothetical protein
MIANEMCCTVQLNDVAEKADEEMLEREKIAIFDGMTRATCSILILKGYFIQPC